MAKGKKTGGRKKGTANVLTATLKDMILQSLDLAGGVQYLVDVAQSSPASYLPLVAKVLPMTVGVDGPGGPLAPRRVIIELDDAGSGAHEK